MKRAILISLLVVILLAGAAGAVEERYYLEHNIITDCWRVRFVSMMGDHYYLKDSGSVGSHPDELENICLNKTAARNLLVDAIRRNKERKATRERRNRINNAWRVME